MQGNADYTGLFIQFIQLLQLVFEFFYKIEKININLQYFSKNRVIRNNKLKLNELPGDYL